MPVIDDYSFRLDTIKRKIVRIEETALSAEKSTDKRNLAKLKVMSQECDTLFAEFHELVNKIAAYYNKQNPQMKAEIQKLHADIVTFEKSYYNCHAIISELFPDQESKLNKSFTGASTSAASTPGLMPGAQIGISLPSLTISSFDGDVTNWSTFSELFKATVHDNMQLSDIQKHMYLRSVLSGEALSLIASLPITSANYSVAWETLQKNYEDTILLTNTYLEALLGCPSITNDSKSIRTFATSIIEYTGALEALGHVVEEWAVLLLFLLRQKLTPKLRERWEKETNTSASVRQFIEFLRSESRLLGSAKPVSEKKVAPYRPKGQHKVTSLTVSTTEKNNSNVPTCLKCGGKHYLQQCDSFKRLDPLQRLRFAKSRQLCLICLSSGHFLKECTRKNACRFCAALHHSLLHIGNNHSKSVKSNASDTYKPSGASVTIEMSKQDTPVSGLSTVNEHVISMQTSTSNAGSSVLLCTARAMVLDKDGSYQPVKVLIDTASEGTFITKSCVDRLGLKENNEILLPVTGLANTHIGVINGSVECIFQQTSRYPFKLTIEALVIDKIARCQSFEVRSQKWPHLKDLPLADPSYRFSEAIDILLGAEWYSLVIIGCPLIGPPGTPSAVESIWGYCLIGRVDTPSKSLKSFCTTSEDSLDESIRKFWEVEEPPGLRGVMLSKEEKLAEEHFVSTVSRQSSGRYVVELPFDPLAPPLRESRASALRRFQHLERKLASKPELRLKYNEFMRDYEQQGHMIPASSASISANDKYYIPHHCIYRTTDDFAKFRVVFDASMKTQNGPSLNQCLLTGPKLQADIVDIILQFRIHEVAIITDIRQMYRNIEVNKKHHNFQRIFWRFDPEQPLKEYVMVTVTYGLRSSPFQAIRILHQLVQDEGDRYPLASSAILNNTYMDDVTISVNDVEKALQIQTELISLLRKAGFSLRKWGSNSIAILETVPEEHRCMSPDIFSFDDSSDVSTKVLGLVWDPKEDHFSYKVQQIESVVVSKRTILSDLARLFDPMGYLSPVVFMGKCLIQYLWQLGLDWDTVPPDNVLTKWRTFREELPLLSNLKLPRYLALDTGVPIELHAFSDSSEKGYGAVLYIRGLTSSGIVKVNLLLAKSKVAPLKRISLPRLELCGAVMAAKLVNYAKVILQPIYKIEKSIVWTDSSVALGWIKASPHQWKTYVANRVTEAQDNLSPEHYRYVPSTTNPADCLSRGLFPSELINHTLWLSGPKWLSQTHENWPPPLNTSTGEKGICEEARIMTLLSQEEPLFWEELLNRFSSLTSLKRVTAYCLRFIRNTQSKDDRRSGFLTAVELNHALFVWIKLVQRSAFKEDFDSLTKRKRPTVRLIKLSPFIDDRGIIRVGGRLHFAMIPFDHKHPILLPKKDHLTELIVDFYHKGYLHPGPSNLHSIISQTFWIISARDVIRKHVAKCLQCFKTKPLSVQPKMGNLPRVRLSEVKAFSMCGVDYGGPFELTMGPLRTTKKYKGYICLFVCLSTRAVHLELTSDLSTETFLAALRRFIARRGSIKEIWSDCGTNFVGARRKLTEWAKFVKSNVFNDAAAHWLGDRGISWAMNPPSSPHFGGSWEAATKSTKKLLHKVVGTQVLTYEEFNTVLIQVESTLNSRPLVPLSSSPDDLGALTPAHFLLQEQSCALIEPDRTTEPINYRKR